ncbi:MAG: hypothetical protein Q8R17_01270 [bacterium]|nr:hypothetical protein [bacterium]
MRNIKERIAAGKKGKGRRVGAVQQKTLLLLLGGFALACTRSLNKQWKIIGDMKQEWKKINRQTAERALASLYDSKLIDARQNNDCTFTIVLNEKGQKRALTYNLGAMRIKQPEKWDGLWRVVSFDIPENIRDARDSLRNRLLNLGFFELQQSFLVHPYECYDEIEYITELYDLRPHVRFMRAGYIDNEIRLKKFFRLPT